MADTQAESSGFKDITSGSSSGTDGSWVELIASLARGTKWMTVTFWTAAGFQAEFDIATGAVSSEVEIISDQFVEHRHIGGGISSSVILSFPMDLDSGTRLSMRIKEDTTAVAYEVVVTVSDTAPLATVPTSSQSKQGLGLVTSGGVDTFGSWVELFSSLTNAIVWGQLMIYCPHSSLTPKAEFEIGKGAGGSEVLAFPAGYRKQRSNTGHARAASYSFPFSIASGTRLAMRIKDESGTNIPYDVGIIVFS